jgi:hypothetical protein
MVEAVCLRAALERVQEEPQQAHPPRQPAQRRLVPHSAPVVATFFRGEVEPTFRTTLHVIE